MKKLLSIIAPIALLSTLAMGGCAKGLGPADTDNVDVTVDTRGATISFWTGFGTSISDKLKEIVADFSAKTGITVEYESKGGYPNLQTAINLSVTKKEFPNVAVGYPDHFAGYVNSNIQLRLDGLIKNDEKRKSDKKDENGHDADADGIRLLDYSNFYKDYTKENESLENALRRFKRATVRDGVIQEVRKREHYEKPSVRRKKKSEAARKRKFK